MRYPSWAGVMNWMFVPPPPNSYVEALIPSTMVFGGGGLWEVIRFIWDHKGGALHDDISALMRRGNINHLQARKCSHQEPNLQAPWSWTSQPPDLSEMFVVWDTQSVVFCYSSPRRLRQQSSIYQREKKLATFSCSGRVLKNSGGGAGALTKIIMWKSLPGAVNCSNPAVLPAPVLFWTRW